MVLVAPRSAKLVEARGARFTLLCGYVFCLLGFLTMLLLWKEDISYWKVGLGYALDRDRRRVSPARRPRTRSPARCRSTRAGMASGTADLQRDLGGAIMQSIMGALLTAGYAAAAAAPRSPARTSTISDSVAEPAARSRSPAPRAIAAAVPAVREPDHEPRRRHLVPAR